MTSRGSVDPSGSWVRRAAPFLLVLTLFCCNKAKTTVGSGKVFPPGKPVPLTYENVSALITDMDQFSSAVKSLDDRTIKTIDARYKDVQFELDQPPLILNATPDPANSKVLFLFSPKDPKTGSNYVLSFDKKLPVIDSTTVEIQLRGDAPEFSLNCRMDVPDPVAYAHERESHVYEAKYMLTKRFYRSGTYDFDALRFMPYRNNGVAFIVFDASKVELRDTTANLGASCN